MAPRPPEKSSGFDSWWLERTRIPPCNSRVVQDPGQFEDHANIRDCFYYIGVGTGWVLWAFSGHRQRQRWRGRRCGYVSRYYSTSMDVRRVFAVEDTHISTDRDKPTRTISNANLFLPASIDNDNYSDGDGDDSGSVGPSSTRTATATRTIAPSAQTLSMHERWIFDRTSIFLSSFLNFMFPNLVELNEKDWRGIKVKHLVETVITAANNNNSKPREVHFFVVLPPSLLCAVVA
ncbi:hypothetical protein K457DRAFT_123251 [Linnemannia elongata AG-77]|uniref:Uncharacterized protein n=1 Tax=Linnemannia elongata AG-77 TaxID=1314771 RepID=A0A197K565_9FUNG|nr:hypothetical protein K457DRAFT_123251 [Linnemannia elongata AG-77]